MKILFVSAILPYPLHSGGQVRIYNLLKRLSQKHDITLYAFIRDEKENECIRELSFCKKVVTVLRGRAWQVRYIFQSLFTSFPFLYATYNNRQMKTVLDQELENTYDLIHLEPGYVWLSLPETKLPVVVSEHNIEHEVYKKYAHHGNFLLRPFMNWDVAKMDRWEKYIWAKADRIVTVSQSDRAIIGQSNASVVPNGVDIKEFAFRPKKSVSKNLTFLYVGNFRWMENRDTAQHLIQDIWPAVKEKYPKATLRIVGKNTPSSTYFVGSVENIQDELYAADIMLAPIRVGGGTKYKILESMATGLPVVTTPLGAQGMNIHDRKEVWIGRTSAEILLAIHDIIGGTQRKKVLEKARKLVEDHYSWDHIAQALDSVWKK